MAILLYTSQNAYGPGCFTFDTFVKWTVQKRSRPIGIFENYRGVGGQNLFWIAYQVLYTKGCVWMNCFRCQNIYMEPLATIYCGIMIISEARWFINYILVQHSDLATLWCTSPAQWFSYYIYCMSPAKWFNFYYDILYESSTLI